MKYTVTIERIYDDGEGMWEATVAEFPDVRGYDATDPAEAAMVAVIAAESLHERRQPRSGGAEHG